MNEIEEATRGSVRFHTVVGIRELFHEEGYRVEPHGGLCRALYTRSAHTPVALFRTVHSIESYETEQRNWTHCGLWSGRMKVSTCRPILASARGTTESRLAVRLVISMANGALILYHGCHNNTDDSDFSDSMHS
jgi:hypothetical protein